MIPILSKFWIFFKDFGLFQISFLMLIKYYLMNQEEKQLRKEGEIKNPRHHIEFYENH